jgi:hypothetical protein
MYSYRLMLSSSQVMHRWPLQDRAWQGWAGQGRAGQGRAGQGSASSEGGRMEGGEGLCLWCLPGGTLPLQLPSLLPLLLTCWRC